MPSQLAYWNIRGVFSTFLLFLLVNYLSILLFTNQELGEPLRLILIFAGEDFEDKRYHVGPPPELSRQAWYDIKHTLGLSFPNLPYYMDDDVKITQSNAIFRYLGRKHNLDGESVKEKADCDVALEAVMDLRNSFYGLTYCGTPEEFKQNREKYVKKAKSQLATFNIVLGEKPFLIGEKPLVCDFTFYESLDQHCIFEPTIIDSFPKLKDYCTRFEALPCIKEYIESGKMRSSPINNAIAHF